MAEEITREVIEEIVQETLRASTQSVDNSWIPTMGIIVSVLVLAFSIYKFGQTQKQHNVAQQKAQQQFNETQKQTEKIMQYDHSPFLAPYMVRDMITNDDGTKKRTGSRRLHIKNIGRGSAVRIKFKIILTNDPGLQIDQKNMKLDGVMATFAFDAPSFNTKVPLEDTPVEFIFQAKYWDVLNKCYYVDEKYLFDINKNSITLSTSDSEPRDILESEKILLDKYPDFLK